MSIATGIGDALADYVRPRGKSRNLTAVARPMRLGARARTRHTSIAIVGDGPLSRQLIWRCLQQTTNGLEVLGLFGDGEEATTPGYCLGCPAG